jgi:hypothetical protein
MKTIGLIGVMGLMASAALHGQSFDSGKELHRGQGDASPTSKHYTLAKPYVINAAMTEVVPKKEKGTEVYKETNPPWVWVRVYDAKTQQMVCSQRIDGFSGRMNVPQGGTHYVQCSAYERTSYILRGIEGKAVVAANGREEIKAMTAAELGGGTAAEAAAVVISVLRDKYSGNALDETIAGVNLVASRSNSAADFTTRLAAYRAQMGW